MALVVCAVADVFDLGQGLPWIRLPQFRALAHRVMGENPATCYFTYRVRLGIK